MKGKKELSPKPQSWPVFSGPRKISRPNSDGPFGYSRPGKSSGKGGQIVVVFKLSPLLPPGVVPDYQLIGARCCRRDFEQV
ncbi:hypothetical protein CRG98_033819 [Punica granatum]|uniref:Uncharacterized protein n=1 Tax=Punica granatum TaxID=22663 RepID=A0A2I0IP93_PUNGR|nr:hypothetical protein CRG98_033819 [Punica granatum]